VTAPALVADSARFAAACQRFDGAPEVALDTEFLRERTYVAELALVQLAADEVVLLDPLGGADLAPLARLLTDPRTTKVLHAARQDIEVLLPLTGRPAGPLKDTQIAAGLLGLAPQIGYAELVRQVLGIELAKGGAGGNLARTDWTRRPLSAAQLSYAADDVRHLLEVAAKLTERLEARDRLAWWVEDCEALLDPGLYAVAPEDAWRRLKGIESLPVREQARVRALAAWRETTARDVNLPRSWVLGDDGLRELAARPPASVEVLKKRGVFREATAERVGDALLHALGAAESATLEGIVQRNSVRPTPEELALSKRLSHRLQTVAGELSLAPEVLATQKDLRRLAHNDRRALGPLAGWRRTVIGELLLNALDGTA
jgi:ribonuclease D